jgi:hypothetical protein
MEIAEARSALVGLWRLLSYADRGAADEPWERTFGEAPTGLILYHQSGLLSAQVAAARWDEAAAWTYIGYVGTFEVRVAEQSGDEVSGVVLHHMAVAHPPELLEEEPERDFRIQGDELMLGDAITARRVFERIG